MSTTPLFGDRLMAITFTLVAAIHLHGQRTIDHLVLFPSNRADPAIEQIARIDSVLSAISVLNIDQAHLIGYTDATGNPTYNLKLAERRVAAVTDLLTARGVAREAITTEALGDKEPEGDNQTAEGRAKNRRVLIRFSVWDEEPPLPITLNGDTCSVDTMIDLGKCTTVTLGRCDARTLLECITFTRVYEPDEFAEQGMDMDTDAGSILATCGMFRMAPRPGCPSEICFDEPIRLRFPIDMCDVERNGERASLWYADTTGGRWNTRGPAGNKLQVRMIRGQAYAIFEFLCVNGMWINCDVPKNRKRTTFKLKDGYRAIDAQLISSCLRSSVQCEVRSGSRIVCRPLCARQYELRLRATDIAGDTTRVVLPLNTLPYRTSLFGGRCGKTDQQGRPLLGIFGRKLRTLYPKYLVRRIDIEPPPLPPGRMFR